MQCLSVCGVLLYGGPSIFLGGGGPGVCRRGPSVCGVLVCPGS